MSGVRADEPEDAARVPDPGLAAAARRLAQGWKSALGESLDEARVLEGIAWLVRALEPGAAEVAPLEQDAGDLLLRRRLLELFRAELVRGWSGSPGADAADMLAILLPLERLRERLEQNRPGDPLAQLSGHNGLDLVVEVAHDLRSPLTSILFLSETLRRGQSGDINDIQRRQLGIIYSAALGLISVASDVIELARGGDRLAEQEPAPFSITEVMESVRDIVQPMAEEKGLTIRLLPPAADQRTGYPVALSRVLLNLTTNALKFTDDGFVEIIARPTSVTRHEFSVRDTGNGMDPEVLSSLYEPFRRVGSRRGYDFSGSGLGLAICRKLVEAMGSELKVETRPKWGTRFYFELELPPVASF